MASWHTQSYLCYGFSDVIARIIAVCINGVGGLTWIFATMLLMAILAMFMLTFRAALHPVKENLINNFTGTIGRSDTGVKSENFSIVGSNISTSILPDGSQQITEVSQIRNEDGTVIMEKTISMVPHIDDLPLPAPVAPPVTTTSTISTGYSNQADILFNERNDAYPETIMPVPLSSISGEEVGSTIGEDGVVIGRTITTSDLSNGRRRVKEVIKIRNPDGSITKRTKVQTQ